VDWLGFDVEWTSDVSWSISMMRSEFAMAVWHYYVSVELYHYLVTLQY
jgi:hypothetical protein